MANVRNPLPIADNEARVVLDRFELTDAQIIEVVREQIAAAYGITVYDVRYLRRSSDSMWLFDVDVTGQTVDPVDL
jgi:hypothetical protein